VIEKNKEEEKLIKNNYILFLSKKIKKKKYI